MKAQHQLVIIFIMITYNTSHTARQLKKQIANSATIALLHGINKIRLYPQQLHYNNYVHPLKLHPNKHDCYRKYYREMAPFFIPLSLPFGRIASPPPIRKVFNAPFNLIEYQERLLAILEGHDIEDY